MSGTKKVTKLRRNLDNLEGNLNIVSDYADGKLSVREIAQKYQTSESNVGLTTKKFWKKLTNMRESRVLKSPTPEFKDTKLALHELQNTDLINKKFIMLLSEPDSALLSDAETTYAWVYVHTGDIIEALKTSGLDVGLFKEKGRDTRFSFDRSLIIRGHYLNSKVNVAEYIKTLREQRLIDANVGKARIQSELVEQLEYMKASGDTESARTFSAA